MSDITSDPLDSDPVSREVLQEITAAMNEMAARMKILQNSGKPFVKGLARAHAKDIGVTLSDQAKLELIYLGMTYVAETYRREFGV